MKTCSWQNITERSAFLTVFLICAVAAGADRINPDFLMFSDPQLQIPEPVKDFNPAMAALWTSALERPDADMQRMASETIARAHQHGIPDLTNAIPSLERILTADSSHPAARFAAARTLIVLDARVSEQKLLDVSQSSGADLKQLIEPALAQWGNAGAASIWLGRIKTPDTGTRDLMLAIQGLGNMRETSAIQDLLAISRDPLRNASLRLEAAKAAGNIQETGFEDIAGSLAEDPESRLFVNQMCAVRLLMRHSSESARQTLTALAGHKEPAIAAAAMQRLNEIDFSLVVPLAESAMKNADPEVRRHGARAMLQRPSAEHIASLSQLLADPQPRLRQEVCAGLYELSKKPVFDQVLRNAAFQILIGDKWQGQEQAAMLLGTLEHQPAADRLVELLESPREEVRIPAAWALRKLAVPRTAAALIDRAKRQTQRRREIGDNPKIDEEVAHLFEALGVLKAEAARELLFEYVPKRADCYHSRAAAIWAIGSLNHGKPDPEAESQLSSRILDFDPQPRETAIVKQMSAVALGRMKAVDQAAMMKTYAMSEDVELHLDVALGWAVRELTGEELPAPAPPVVSQGSWFLEPLN